MSSRVHQDLSSLNSCPSSSLYMLQLGWDSKKLTLTKKSSNAQLSLWLISFLFAIKTLLISKSGTLSRSTMIDYKTIWQETQPLRLLSKSQATRASTSLIFQSWPQGCLSCCTRLRGPFILTHSRPYGQLSQTIQDNSRPLPPLSWRNWSPSSMITTCKCVPGLSKYPSLSSPYLALQL